MLLLLLSLISAKALLLIKITSPTMMTRWCLLLIVLLLFIRHAILSWLIVEVVAIEPVFFPRTITICATKSVSATLETTTTAAGISSLSSVS